jgi:hypothetical protein
MTAVRRDIDPIAGPEETGFDLICKTQLCGPGEDQHPFVFRLVIPEPGWARLTPRDDPLDAQARLGQ